MTHRHIWRIAGVTALLALLGGCGGHGAAPAHKKTASHKTAAKAAAVPAGTPVAVDGYTAYLPQDVLANTPGLDVALTPYGLVWSSYADAQDAGGALVMPHPFAVEVSPTPGSGPLAGSGRLVAEIPASAGLQSADLHFVGTSGPYLGFTLDVAGTATTIGAGMLDLRTGQITMAPENLTSDAGVVVAGERMGILAPNATYVMDPRSGSLQTYPVAAGSDLWQDLAYGLPIGQSTMPDPAGPGVVPYAAGSVTVYGPPAWQETSERLGGGFTIWRLRDPGDPAAFVEVETAPCVGCSVVSLTDGALPAPQVVLPDATATPDVSEHWLSDYVIAYHGTVKGYHYPVWGLAIAPRPGQSGFEEVVVALPEAEASLAQDILGRYPLPR
jgi:hypothetical protein